MKIETQCTNCGFHFDVDTDFLVADICPNCGHAGVIRFRQKRKPTPEQEEDLRKGYYLNDLIKNK